MTGTSSDTGSGARGSAGRGRILKVVLPLVVLSVALLGAFVLVRTPPEVATSEPQVPPPLVRVVTATPGAVRLDVPSQGTVLPRTETTLVSQVAGEVVQVSPDFAAGGAVRPGQILVQIDRRDYELALARAEAGVAQAEVRLAREEAEARVARDEWQALATEGGAPDPLVVREPQLAEARASLAASRAALQRARLDLDRTAVRAPFHGRVREKKVGLGQSVTPGTPLGHIYATDSVEVELPVAVADLAYLDVELGGTMDPGPTVELRAEFAGRERRWQGRVVRSAGEIDPRTRMLGLIARVQDPFGEAARRAGAPLAVGLFVEASIAGRSVEDVFVLPRAALRMGGSQRPGESGRVLVVDEGKLRYREVEILRMVGDRAILSGGLDPGDLVCISPLETPMEGMTVRTVLEEAPSTDPAPVPGVES